MLYLKPWDNEANKPSQEILDSTSYLKLIPAAAEEPQETSAPDEAGSTSEPAAETADSTASPEATATSEAN
jgi:hypothetical protein